MIREAFNWLAGTPSKQYTLFEGHSFKFNRAARLVERFHTIPGIAVAGVIAVMGIPALAVGAPVATVGAVGFGALVLAFAKVNGLVCGALTHLVAKGLSGLANHVSESAAKPANQGVEGPKL